MEFQSVSVKSTIFEVDLVASANRNAYAKVRKGRIVISVPKRINRKYADKVAEGLYLRIKRSIERNPDYYINKKESTPLFNDFDAIEALGKRFTIRLYDCNAATGSAIIYNEEIRVFLPKHWDAAKRKESTAYMIRMVVTKNMKIEVIDRIRRINAAYFNSKISSVRITNASSRWGSCSRPRGSDSSRISINFKLLLMDEQFLNMVIVHELAHTKELNHSKRFWTIVERIVPDYKGRKRELNNGAKIRIYKADSGISQIEPPIHL